MINMQFLRNFKTSDKSYLLLSVILKKKILLELLYITKSANCCFVIFANQEKWILNPWLEKMLFYVFVCVRAFIWRLFEAKQYSLLLQCNNLTRPQPTGHSRDPLALDHPSHPGRNPHHPLPPLHPGLGMSETSKTLINNIHMYWLM